MLEIVNLKREDFQKYSQRIQMNSSDVLMPVQEIIDNVCQNKDKALHDYTLKFDGADIDNFKVDEKTITESLNKIDPDFKKH